MDNSEEKSLIEENALLKKELQLRNRELEIEGALEKIRSRTMAMRASDELSDSSVVLFQQLKELKINALRTSVGIFDDANNAVELWTTFSDKKEEIKILDYLSLYIHPVFENTIPARQKGKPYAVTMLEGRNLREFYETMSTYLPAGQSKQNECEYFYSFFFPAGILNVVADQSLSEEECSIMIRLASVFGLIYTRFLDLQKAEEQARESKIETALERVRSSALAMQSPQDLTSTIDVFYGELVSLCTRPLRCGVGIIHAESRVANMWTITSREGKTIVDVDGEIRLEGHAVLDGLLEHWLRKQEYQVMLSGDEIGAYYKAVPQLSNLPYKDEVQYGYFFMFPEAYVFAWTASELDEDELEIYRRFTSVISLTYKRYIDLQIADGNTREMVKQTSLDRIRAEIASMRTADDLEKITPLIWNELTTLGVPFIRCGVFIMDETQQLVHTFLSTPEGKAIASLNVPFDTEIPLFSHGVSHWRDKKIYTDHWDAAAFTSWWESFSKMGAISSEDQDQRQHPPEDLFLHMIPFVQGMLYVGNTLPLDADDIDLLNSVASAFSTAYARYEDFKKLELAKKNIESTLTELKLAQSQLVQSEKMASLGELTAGIAHEIQNPLNFVKNFTEVSVELLQEMNSEIDNNNPGEVKAIAESVIQNLEKILHHGRRADGIVKGMLQHSRGSGGVKELTDLNALTDEYLRLAYHGLRAKDKMFSATLETEFDESLEKIEVAPQDIGRVILNLITNAFYAVTERKKREEGFEPTVFVNTKKVGRRAVISVKDNGNGIPQLVIDKIFQPFFTTKPTGHGTGLGLSLSYDIIKSHGGEINVETSENEYTIFIISLPYI